MGIESLNQLNYFFGSITTRGRNRLQFTTADVNNDGHISQEEFHDIKYMFNSDNVDFSKLDLNDNKEIDESEWQKLQIKMDFQQAIDGVKKSIARDFTGVDTYLIDTVVGQLSTFLNGYVSSMSMNWNDPNIQETFSTALNNEYERICDSLANRRPSVIIDATIQDMLADGNGLINSATMSGYHQTLITNTINAFKTNWIAQNHDSIVAQFQADPDSAAQNVANSLREAIQEYLNTVNPDTGKTKLQELNDDAMQNEYDHADEAVTTLTGYKTNLENQIQTAITNANTLKTAIENIPNYSTDETLQSIYGSLESALSDLGGDCTALMHFIEGRLTAATDYRDAIATAMTQSVGVLGAALSSTAPLKDISVPTNSKEAEKCANNAVNALNAVTGDARFTTLTTAINTVNSCQTSWNSYNNTGTADSGTNTFTDNYTLAVNALDNKYTGTRTADSVYKLDTEVQKILNSIRSDLANTGIPSSVIDEAWMTTYNYYSDLIMRLDSASNVGKLLTNQLTNAGIERSAFGDDLRGAVSYTLSEAKVKEKFLRCLQGRGLNTFTVVTGLTNGTTGYDSDIANKLQNYNGTYTSEYFVQTSTWGPLVESAYQKTEELIDSMKNTMISAGYDKTAVKKACDKTKNDLRMSLITVAISTSLPTVRNNVDLDWITFVANTENSYYYSIGKSHIAEQFRNNLVNEMNALDDAQATINAGLQNWSGSTTNIDNVSIDETWYTHKMTAGFSTMKTAFNSKIDNLATLLTAAAVLDGIDQSYAQKAANTFKSYYKAAMASYESISGENGEYTHQLKGGGFTYNDYVTGQNGVYSADRSRIAADDREKNVDENSEIGYSESSDTGIYIGINRNNGGNGFLVKVNPETLIAKFKQFLHLPS